MDCQIHMDYQIYMDYNLHNPGFFISLEEFPRNVLTPSVAPIVGKRKKEITGFGRHETLHCIPLQ